MDNIIQADTDPSSAVELKKWTRSLPYSRMIYPKSLPHRFKYVFWRVYTPCHPLFRDTMLALGVVAHSGRQDFHIGKLVQDRTIEDLISFLISKGYGNHFIAWKDQGELVGLRYVEDFVHQYHIRIFNDGEVRGHYEYTPECYPILHFKKIGQEDRRQYFLDLMGDWLVSVDQH